MDTIDLVIVRNGSPYQFRLSEGGLKESVLASLIQMTDEITKAFMIAEGKPEQVLMVEHTPEFGKREWPIYDERQIDTLYVLATALEFDPGMAPRVAWIKAQIKKNRQSPN